MAKTKFGIADAIRNEVKTPAPAAVEHAEAPAVAPAEPKVDIAPAPSTATEKAARKRGRPRKEDDRHEFVRTAVPTDLKNKLHIICRQKNVTESDYVYELLRKAVDRDFERAFADMRGDIE